jgi:putative aldouronate transport system substrate-binding protein
MRPISIVLAALMVTLAAAGCQKKKVVTNANAVHQTLTVEVFDRGKPGQPDLNNNYWTQYVNSNFGKQFNATVTYVPVPRSQEVDKLNVLMAANQSPDIACTYDQGTIYNYVQQGGLAQLDTPLKEYGQNLTKYLGQDVLKYGKFNGKMYSVPGKRTVLMGFNTFIRKDWLDKLGLPLPKTADEFYNDMVAFQQKNPGNVKTVIPYGYQIDNEDTAGTAYMVEAFIPPTLSAEQRATLETNPDYQANWNLPGYEDYIKYMNKMYNAGLIGKDFASDKGGKQLDANISNGFVGAYSSNWDSPYRTAPGDYTNLKKNVPGAELVPIDPWQNSAGKYPEETYSPNGMYIIIPKTSKVVNLAIQYLNWMSESKNTLYLQNGQEGVDYNMVNGVPVQTGTTTSGNKMMTVANNLDYDLLSNGIEIGDPQKDIVAVSAGYPGFQNDVNQSAKTSMIDPYQPYYYSIPNASHAKDSQALIDLSVIMISKLLVCPPAQVDSLYKTLVSQFMAQGGQANYNEYVKNYKAQNATSSSK